MQKTQDWENELGTTLERTVKLGKCNKQKSGKLPNQQHIQKLGRGSVQLQKAEKLILPSKLLRSKTGLRKQDSGHGNLFSEQDDDMEDLILDSEWNTKDWSADKVEASLEALYDAVENSEDFDKRHLATRMILRLFHHHEVARRNLEGDIEMFIRKCMGKLGRMADRHAAFRALEFVATCCKILPEKISKMHAVNRTVAILNGEMDAGIRIIQLIWRHRVYERTAMDMPRDIKFRARVLYRMKLIDLKGDFHRIRFSVLEKESIPNFALQRYLEVLVSLTSMKYGEKLGTRNRDLFMREGGMVCIVMCLKRNCPQIKSLVNDLLCHVCEEPQWTVSILKSDIFGKLSEQLSHSYQENNSRHVCVLLGIFLKMGHCAIEDVQVWENQTFEFLRHRKNLPTYLNTFMGSREIVVSLLQGIQHTQKSVKLLVLKAVHKIACSTLYFPVLNEVVSLGGKYLYDIVQELQGTDLNISIHALYLLQQLCNKSEGQGGLMTAGFVDLLLPLCAKPSTSKFARRYMLLGLCGLVFVARHGQYPQVYKIASYDDDQLMRFTYTTIATCSYGNSANIKKSSMRLLNIGAMPIIVALLVRNVGKTSEAHDLYESAMSTRLAAQLFSNEDVAAAVYCGAFIEYLALVLQGCQVDLSENLHLRMNSDQKLLFYESMRDACQGLSNLCRCVTNESNKSHYQNVYGNVQVCKELFRLHALEDVLALIHKPSYQFPSDELEIQTITSAMDLISFLCLTAERETEYESEMRQTIQPKSMVDIFDSMMHALVVEASPCLMTTLTNGVNSQELIAFGCKALARLCTTNKTCASLLDAGCVSLLSELIPNFASKAGLANTTSEIQFNSSGEYSSDERKLGIVPSSVYTLLSELCRLPSGKKRIAEMNLVVRVIRRIRISMGGKQHDTECKTELAYFIGCIANLNLPCCGNLNDTISRYGVFQDLIIAIHESPYNFWLLYNTLRLMDKIAQDMMGALPSMIQHEAVFPLLTSTLHRYHEISDLKHDRIYGLVLCVLQCLERIASYPNELYHHYFYDDQAGDTIDYLMILGRSMTLELSNKDPSKTTIGSLARTTIKLLQSSSRHSSKPSSSPRKLSKIETPATFPVQSWTGAFSPCTTEEKITTPLPSPRITMPVIDLVNPEYLHTRPLGASPSKPTAAPSNLKVVSVEQTLDSRARTAKLARRKAREERKAKTADDKSYKFARPKQNKPASLLLLDPLFD